MRIASVVTGALLSTLPLFFIIIIFFDNLIYNYCIYIVSIPSFPLQLLCPPNSLSNLCYIYNDTYITYMYIVYTQHTYMHIYVGGIYRYILLSLVCVAHMSNVFRHLITSQGVQSWRRLIL